MLGVYRVLPALSHNRFMGAWAFSKYLAFPLYWERLMAFDVGGWGLRESWQAQVKNMAHGVCMCVFAQTH